MKPCVGLYETNKLQRITNFKSRDRTNFNWYPTNGRQMRNNLVFNSLIHYCARCSTYPQLLPCVVRSVNLLPILVQSVRNVAGRVLKTFSFRKSDNSCECNKSNLLLNFFISKTIFHSLSYYLVYGLLIINSLFKCV